MPCASSVVSVACGLCVAAWESRAGRREASHSYQRPARTWHLIMHLIYRDRHHAVCHTRKNFLPCAQT